MSCNTCTQSFGMFRKELGCANCGFSFCSKCLGKKAPVPKLGNKKAAVCAGCYRTLAGSTEDHGKGSRKEKSVPDDPFHAEASNSSKQHHFMYPSQNLPPPSMRSAHRSDVPRKQGPSGASRPIGQNKTVSDTDAQMNARLDKLKAERIGEIPSQQEIEERFAALRGQSVDQVRHPGDRVFPTDRRTCVEQERDLLQEMKSRAELDAKMPAPEVEVANRLAQLRGETKPDENSVLPDSSCGTSGMETENFDDSGLTASKDSEGLSTTTGADSSSSVTVDQIDSFLKEAQAEADREAKAAMLSLNQDAEIQQRLKQIKETVRQETLKDDAIGAELGRFINDDSDEGNLEDEEEKDGADGQQADLLARKIIAEQELEEKLGALHLPSGDLKNVEASHEHKHRIYGRSTSGEETRGAVRVPAGPSRAVYEDQEEEYPWCCICTEDAAVRCLGCDGDLYCRRCFKEGHDREDLTTHKWVSYKKPKVQTVV